MFDIVVLMGFLRPGGIIGDKTIGIFGTLSSLIGVYQNWNWLIYVYMLFYCSKKN